MESPGRYRAVVSIWLVEFNYHLRIIADIMIHSEICHLLIGNTPLSVCICGYFMGVSNYKVQLRLWVDLGWPSPLEPSPYLATSGVLWETLLFGVSRLSIWCPRIGDQGWQWLSFGHISYPKGCS